VHARAREREREREILSFLISFCFDRSRSRFFLARSSRVCLKFTLITGF